MALAMLALQTTASKILKVIPGKLVFSPDTFLGNPLFVSFHHIFAWMNQLVNDTLLGANKKHVYFDYKIKHIWYGKLKLKTTEFTPMKLRKSA